MLIHLFQSLIEQEEKKKNSNGVEDLNQSKKLDLMDIYRTPEPKIAESTFFSSTPWSLTKRLHVGP